MNGKTWETYQENAREVDETIKGTASELRGTESEYLQRIAETLEKQAAELRDFVKRMKPEE